MGGDNVIGSSFLGLAVEAWFDEDTSTCGWTRNLDCRVGRGEERFRGHLNTSPELLENREQFLGREAQAGAWMLC
jgi:hypothetical protein